MSKTIHPSLTTAKRHLALLVMLQDWYYKNYSTVKNQEVCNYLNFLIETQQKAVDALRKKKGKTTKSVLTDKGHYAKLFSK